MLNPVVPVRIRRILNVESGLNDGLATPVVLFAIAALAGEEGLDTKTSVTEALVEILIGVVVGVVVGFLAGKALTVSRDKEWSSAGQRALGIVVLPLATYQLAVVVSGNGFIAAFVAGTCTGAAANWFHKEASALALTESVADLIGFAVWFIFGLALTRVLSEFDWRVLLYALLSLTALRMVPVWLCLLGTGLKPVTVGFIGWFGPRGLASVVFAVIAIESLEADPRLKTALAVIGTTVLLSVVLHGLSADPLAERFGAWVKRTRPTVETGSAPVPTSRGGR